MKLVLAMLLLAVFGAVGAAPPDLATAARSDSQAYLRGYLAVELKRMILAGDIDGALEQLQVEIDAASEVLGYDIEESLNRPARESKGSVDESLAP